MNEILHKDIVKRWTDVELDLLIGIFLIILFITINNAFNKLPLIFDRKMLNFAPAFLDYDLVLLAKDVSVRLSHI